MLDGIGVVERADEKAKVAGDRFMLQFIQTMSVQVSQPHLQVVLIPPASPHVAHRWISSALELVTSAHFSLLTHSSTLSHVSAASATTFSI